MVIDFSEQVVLFKTFFFTFLEGAISLVDKLADVTPQVELKVSSRAAMIGSLNDNSTETFWESGDEDRNKSKWVAIAMNNKRHATVQSVSIHIDNGRDMGNKVSSVTFKCGRSVEDVAEQIRVKQVDVESRFAGWVSCFLDRSQIPFDFNCVRIELKGEKLSVLTTTTSCDRYHFTSSPVDIS